MWRSRLEPPGAAASPAGREGEALFPAARDVLAVRRRTVLAGLLAVVASLTAFVLWRVVTTIFLAVTVAFVARPFYTWLQRRGVPRYGAATVTTATVFLGVLAVAAPLAAVLYGRSGEIVAIVQGFPDELTISALGLEYTVFAGDVWTYLGDVLQGVAIDAVNAAPLLALEVTLFAAVVFGVLLGQHRAAAALVALVPREYHDVLDALTRRAKSTLWTLYVLQLLTAVATFAIAIPVFYVLDYELFLTLAVFCGLLQFLPIVGPSAVLLALAGYHVAVGEVAAAVIVLALGGVLIAVLPDLVVRPYLARSRADMPATLYFVGFVGGLVSLGPVGIIAGPLLIALVVECVSLLAEELRVEAEDVGA